MFSQSCTRTQALNLHYLQFLESCNLICLLPFGIPITNLAISQNQFDWIIWWLRFDNRLILWKLSWSELTFFRWRTYHILSVIIWVMENQMLPIANVTYFFFSIRTYNLGWQDIFYVLSPYRMQCIKKWQWKKNSLRFGFTLGG